MNPDTIQWISEFGIQLVLCGAFLWVTFVLFKRYFKLVDDGKRREKEYQALVKEQWVVIKEQREVIKEQLGIIQALSEYLPEIKGFLQKLHEILKRKWNDGPGVDDTLN